MRIILVLLLLALSVPARAEKVRVLLYQGAELSEPMPEQAGECFSFRGRTYRGELQVLKERDRTLLIDSVELEDYLRGVVPRELSCKEVEAMKAQAVVARTYALSHLRPDRPYDVLGSEKSQVYGGKDAEQAGSDLAVQATAGEVLLYQGKLARQVVYCSTCGGATEAKERIFSGLPVSYLGGVTCEYCQDSPLFHWRLEISAADLGQELERLLRKPVVPLTGLQQLERHPSGRVHRLAILGRSPGLELRGDDMRRYLCGKNPQGQLKPLYSTKFTVESLVLADRTPGFVFLGQGWGHGVGMCQWGAVGLARAGKDYKEILDYYFTGTQVARQAS